MPVPDYSSFSPSTLTPAQLDAAITELAARVASFPEVQDNKLKLLAFRIDRLDRAYAVAKRNRITADPLLANTSTVSVTA